MRVAAPTGSGGSAPKDRPRRSRPPRRSSSTPGASAPGGRTNANGPRIYESTCGLRPSSTGRLVRSPVADLLGDLVASLGGIGVRWYLFGAQAAILHGAARLTADVDVTAELGSREPGELLDALRLGGGALRELGRAAWGGRGELWVVCFRSLPHGAARPPADVDATAELGSREPGELLDALRLGGFALR